MFISCIDNRSDLRKSVRSDEFKATHIITREIKSFHKKYSKFAGMAQKVQKTLLMHWSISQLVPAMHMSCICMQECVSQHNAVLIYIIIHIILDHECRAMVNAIYIIILLLCKYCFCTFCAHACHIPIIIIHLSIFVEIFVVNSLVSNCTLSI